MIKKGKNIIRRKKTQIISSQWQEHWFSRGSGGSRKVYIIQRIEHTINSTKDIVLNQLYKPSPFSVLHRILSHFLKHTNSDLDLFFFVNIGQRSCFQKRSFSMNGLVLQSLTHSLCHKRFLVCLIAFQLSVTFNFIFVIKDVSILRICLICFHSIGQSVTIITFKVFLDI